MYVIQDLIHVHGMEEENERNIYLFFYACRTRRVISARRPPLLRGDSTRGWRANKKILQDGTLFRHARGNAHVGTIKLVPQKKTTVDTASIFLYAR